MFKGRNVLITGGLGFIGSSLAKELISQGANVSIVDNLDSNGGANFFNLKNDLSKLTFVKGSISNDSLMKSLISNVDFIFNLAAQTSHTGSMQNPIYDLDVNYRSQLALLELCKIYNSGVRIVFASTRQVYGSPINIPVSEGHAINPPDVNAINKYSAECAYNLYHQLFGIQSTVVRLTNTYGPRMRIQDAKQTFVGYWIKLILLNKSFSIYGDGTQLRDFLYIDDCVSALILAATSPNTIGNTYNLGTSDAISLIELADLLCEINNGCNYSLMPFPHDRKQIDIGSYATDNTYFNQATGWKPNIRYIDGFTRTLNFYKEHLINYL